jgi:hypothetical protein
MKKKKNTGKRVQSQTEIDAKACVRGEFHKLVDEACDKADGEQDPWIFHILVHGTIKMYLAIADRQIFTELDKKRSSKLKDADLKK